MVVVKFMLLFGCRGYCCVYIVSVANVVVVFLRYHWITTFKKAALAVVFGDVCLFGLLLHIIGSFIMT